jgi:hypothetical protein
MKWFWKPFCEWFNRRNFGKENLKEKEETILAEFSGLRALTRRQAILGSAVIARPANPGRSPGCRSEGIPVLGDCQGDSGWKGGNENNDQDFRNWLSSGKQLEKTRDLLGDLLGFKTWALQRIAQPSSWRPDLDAWIGRGDGHVVAWSSAWPGLSRFLYLHNKRKEINNRKAVVLAQHQTVCVSWALAWVSSALPPCRRTEPPVRVPGVQERQHAFPFLTNAPFASLAHLAIPYRRRRGGPWWRFFLPFLLLLHLISSPSPQPLPAPTGYPRPWIAPSGSPSTSLRPLWWQPLRSRLPFSPFSG